MNPEFLSGESSASPAVEPLLAGARRLDRAGYGAGVVSARNGPRVTTHAQTPLGMLSPADFVEVADYDPHLDRTLCIGRTAPHPLAALHALVYRAKREVGAMVAVEVDAARPSLADLPRLRRGATTLEGALAVLEALRAQDAVLYDRWLLTTGRFPGEAFARAEALLGVPA